MSNTTPTSLTPAPTATQQVANFILQHKRAIILTAVVSAGAVGAYYYTNQPGGAGSSSRRSDTAADELKKKKKKAKRAAAGAAGKTTNETQTGESVTPTTQEVKEGEKQIAQESEETTATDIEVMTAEQRNKLALQLKAKGNKLYSAKQYEEAVKAYTKAIECEEQAVFYSNRAACYTNLKQEDKVVEDCTAALRLDPSYIKALNRRGTAREAIGGIDSLYLALCDFTAAAIIDNFQTEATQVSVERVMKKLAGEKAIELLKTREPRLPSPTFIKAYLEAFRPQTAPKLPENPSQGDQTLQLAFDALGAKDFHHAFTLFHEALEQEISTDEGKAAALNMRATFRFIMSDAKSALADLDEATNLWPTGTQSWVKKASVHMELGQQELAFEDFEQALQVNPKDADVFYHRGQVYFITGEFDKAITEYRKSSELDPQFIFSHIQLAVAQYKSGSVEKALAQFRRLAREFPSAPEVFNYYGELLLDQQRFEEAQEAFTKSIELDSKSSGPRNALPVVNRALAIFQWKQDFNQADQICREALELDSQCDVAVATLAQLLLQQNKIHDAVKMFEKSAEMSRTEPELVNALTYECATRAQINFIETYPAYAEKLGLNRSNAAA